MVVIYAMWTMRTMAAQLQNVYRTICDNGSSHREDEYQAILDALKARVTGAARQAMRAHFTRTIDALLTASEDEALQEVKRYASESRSRFVLTKWLS